MRPAIRGVLAYASRRHTAENAGFRARNPVSLSCEIFGVAAYGQQTQLQILNILIAESKANILF